MFKSDQHFEAAILTLFAIGIGIVLCFYRILLTPFPDGLYTISNIFIFIAIPLFIISYWLPIIVMSNQYDEKNTEKTK